jgi:SagB-type dehydrogenase family enzyme
MYGGMILTIGLGLLLVAGACRQEASQGSLGGEIKLPKPKDKGSMSVEEALSRRRSVREYSDQPLSLPEVSQVLWAAQRVTSPRGFRTAPSAGATYPMELYLTASWITGLSCGFYHYQPDRHSLRLVAERELNRELAEASLSQSWISAAPANLIIAAVYERTTKRYGQRGIRYVYMEAGHIAENVCLQAEAMGLGTVVVGAFEDEAVQKVLQIKEEPLYIMPLGKK